MPRYLETVSKHFAQCLCVFRKCSIAVQEVIVEMAGVVDDPKATQEEREAAVATIVEALFPSGREKRLNQPMCRSIDLDPRSNHERETE